MHPIGNEKRGQVNPAELPRLIEAYLRDTGDPERDIYG